MDKFVTAYPRNKQQADLLPESQRDVPNKPTNAKVKKQQPGASEFDEPQIVEIFSASP